MCALNRREVSGIKIKSAFNSKNIGRLQQLGLESKASRYRLSGVPARIGRGIMQGRRKCAATRRCAKPGGASGMWPHPRIALRHLGKSQAAVSGMSKSQRQRGLRSEEAKLSKKIVINIPSASRHREGARSACRVRAGARGASRAHRINTRSRAKRNRRRAASAESAKAEIPAKSAVHRQRIAPACIDPRVKTIVISAGTSHKMASL